MRYCISLNLDFTPAKPYSFNGKLISDFLEVEQTAQPEPYISATTLTYNREKPGLTERNWKKPWFNNERYFIYLAGTVLFRNRAIKDNNYAPTPGEALEILLQEGDQHYQTLKGTYYILLFDKQLREVDIYSSPMFMHPAFYSFTDGQLVFSNYIEAFHDYRPLSVAPQGMLEFALFDHCLHDRTIYQGLRLIPGGHRIRLSGQGVSESLLYDLANWHIPNPEPRSATLHKINDALKSAINHYVKSTDTFNIAFTGGFDGRLNFSYIEKEDYPRLKAMSYGMPGSTQITIPQHIGKKLGFKYEPVWLDEAFEKAFPQVAMQSVFLTAGVTGFHRAVYPYAYNQIKDFSRSCIIGQCDMIRPLFNNPAGVIFNDCSFSLFYGTYQDFKNAYAAFARNALLRPEFFSDEARDLIYEEVQSRYIRPYPALSDNLRFYFFLLKESLMKYWHTEFHLVDIFVDDYVSFGDLDYLEELFNSQYAGIYKGLLAKNQWGRRFAHDLYVDLMALNNDRLNFFYNDRLLKPGWLKYGLPGMALAAAGKQVFKWKTRRQGDDTFDMPRWSKAFLQPYREPIVKDSGFFRTDLISRKVDETMPDSGDGYRFNRVASLKIWMDHLGLQ